MMLLDAGNSQHLRRSSSSMSPGQSRCLPVMQPLPSTFSRSPANSPLDPASAPGLAPQDWLRQSEALGSLRLQGSGTDAPSQGRDLYRVDLQVSTDLSPCHDTRAALAEGLTKV